MREKSTQKNQTKTTKSTAQCRPAVANFQKAKKQNICQLEIQKIQNATNLKNSNFSSSAK